MRANPLVEFCKRFEIDPPTGVVMLKESYFQIPDQLKPIFSKVKERCEYAGVFLGSGKRFFTPSAIFLDRYLVNSPKKTVLDRKSAWLFVCGRDVFPEGVLQEEGLMPLDPVVVFDNAGVVLGYGIYYPKPSRYGATIAIKNEYDRGMLLRREMSKKGPSEKGKESSEKSSSE